MNNLLQVTHAAQVAQRKILDELVEKSIPGQDWEEFEPTQRLLLGYLLDRGHAVLRLVAIRLDFDAEILLRTFYEVSAKIMLITFTPKGERPEMLKEYWTALGEVADRKTAYRAELAEAIVPPEKEDARNSLKLLQRKNIVRNNLSLNKAARKRLEQKWSFPEVLQRLDGLAGAKRAGATSLLHVYGMASHLAHADCRAMELYLDRMFRPADERIGLEDSHAARIMSDIAQVGAYCAVLAASGANLGAEENLQLVARTAKEVGTVASAVIDDFDATQRDFYQSMMGDGLDEAAPPAER
jgi:hypothetical protein